VELTVVDKCEFFNCVHWGVNDELRNVLLSNLAALHRPRVELVSLSTEAQGATRPAKKSFCM
jgi:transposase